MKSRYLEQCVACLLALTIGILPLAGQGIKKEPTVKVKVDLVSIYVSVLNPYTGGMVTGLGPGQFRVFEGPGCKPGKISKKNCIEQEIDHVSVTDVPMSIGIVFDSSGSIGDKLPQARSAMAEFMKTSNPLDEFCLIDFVDGNVRLVSDFTSAEDMEPKLLQLGSKGMTPLLDGIYLGLQKLEAKRREEHENINALKRQGATPSEIEKATRRRALLIVSDGGDNHSRYNENHIKDLSKEGDTQVEAIGIYDPISGRSRTPEELNGPELLQRITELTGGHVFDVTNPGDIVDVAVKVSGELKTQYALFFKLDHSLDKNEAKDGKRFVFRKVAVTVDAPKGMPPLKIYAKDGYYKSTN